MIRRLLILAILAVAGCQPALALDVTVQAGTAISNVQVAIEATVTSTPPHTITLMPGNYPLFDNTRLTNGVVCSITRGLTGYGSAADTFLSTNSGGRANLLMPQKTMLCGIGFPRYVGQLVGSGSSIESIYSNCRFTDVGAAGVYGGIAYSGGSFVACEFIRPIGLDVIVNAPLIANSVFIAGEGYGSFASIIRTDNSSRAYLIEGNTFAACKVAGNRGIINSDGQTTTTIRNNSVTYTNNAWSGSALINAGGNVSNGATFFNPPVGYGTNAAIAGADLRLIPNCPAWSAGVFTNSALYAPASNTAYDIRGMNWRGQTNNAAGAYWINPLDYPQFQGGLLP